MKTQFLFSLFLLHLCGQSLAGFPFFDEKVFGPDVCTYRTQTVQEFSRNCPLLFPFAGVGCFRDRNFESCFAQGISVGCSGNITMLQNSEQVQSFLSDSASTLEAQLVALNLNLGFDQCVEDWSTCQGAFGDLFICQQAQGACEGFESMQIRDLLDMGNQVAGGCGQVMEGDRARYYACISYINNRFSYGRSLRAAEEFAENECPTPEPIMETTLPPFTTQPTTTQPTTTRPLTTQPTTTRPLTTQPTTTQPLTTQPTTTRPLTTQPTTTQPLTTQPLTTQPLTTQPLTTQPTTTQPLTTQPTTTQPLTTEPTTPEPIIPTETPVTPQPRRTIYSVISQSAQLSTMTSLVQQSGWQPVLSNPLANLLFFAPTNQALEGVPQQQGQGNLQQYVAYHIIAPNRNLQSLEYLENLSAGQIVWTSAGLSLHLRYDQQTGTLRANGVAIDQVIRLTSSNQSVAIISMDLMIPNGTLYDMIVSDPNLSTFAEAVMSVGGQIVQQLQDPRVQLTVFAPTNEAFDQVDLQAADLSAVVQNHIISNQVLFTSELDDGDILSSNLGQSLMVTRQDGQIQINGATIQDGDRFAVNGILHPVDQVILPAQAQ